MKPFWKDVCLAGFFGLVVPGVMLGIAVSFSKSDGSVQLPEETVAPPSPLP